MQDVLQELRSILEHEVALYGAFLPTGDPPAPAPLVAPEEARAGGAPPTRYHDTHEDHEGHEEHEE